MHALNVRIMQPLIERLATSDEAASVAAGGEEWKLEEMQELLD
jgi:hypothetical protein